jgi:glutamate 5-kinase
MSTVVIKLGSSVVADDRGEVRRDILAQVIDQVAGLHHGGDAVILVTSGAIARGMGLMQLPMRPSQMDELQAASAVGQGKLYRTYDELLAEREVPSAQVLLTFFDLAARRHYLNARATLERLLLWRVVPVINENDTVTTDEISFGDNDFLAAQVAVLMSADALLLLTDTDGVYTADPRIDPTARLLTEVSSFEQLEELQIGVSTSPLGSGGMRSKVVASEMATAAGIPAWIVNGTRAGTIQRALEGEQEGTRFAPQRSRVSSFKLWLKYAKPTQGRIVVDAGAANALRERGTSLLPVGIVDVLGEFEAGDAVEVCPGNGNATAIGKGIVNYSAEELRRIKGMRTVEVREVLPRASDEAVHRDYFVLD